MKTSTGNSVYLSSSTVWPPPTNQRKEVGKCWAFKVYDTVGKADNAFNSCDLFALWAECALEDEVFEDGAETRRECNKCVCACGNWVCTALTCDGEHEEEQFGLHLNASQSREAQFIVFQRGVWNRSMMMKEKKKRWRKTSGRGQWVNSTLCRFYFFVKLYL